MKKLTLLILFLFICSTSIAAPPSRQNTYVSGTTIQAANVTANEDAIFNYLSAGVDTFKDDTILNADINSSAAIATSKIDFSQALTISGALTFTGNNTFAGTTIANIGTITTGAITSIDLQGGTLKPDRIDGGVLSNTSIQVGPSATGELIVNNSSDYAAGLGSQGTSGQFLQSAGAGANPTWATPSMDLTLLSATSKDSVTNSTNITIAASKLYRVLIMIEPDTTTDTEILLRFNDDSDNTEYQYVRSLVAFGGSSSDTTHSSEATSSIDLGSIEGTDNDGSMFYWLEFNTYQFQGTQNVWVSGHGTGRFVTNYGHVDLTGFYDGGSPTSFELISDNNTDMDIWVYEYSQS